MATNKKLRGRMSRCLMAGLVLGGLGLVGLGVTGCDEESAASLANGEFSKADAAARPGRIILISDQRVKNNIKTVRSALETLDKVRITRFRYNQAIETSHPELAGHEHFNVLAQEYATIFPGHVKDSGERMADGSPILCVDTTPLVGYSVAAIQELNELVRAKDSQIAELTKRLNRIESQVNSAE